VREREAIAQTSQQRSIVFLSRPAPPPFYSLGLMMSAAGGAWDNAKKFVETGEFGGKKSPAHTATIVGDTVGDPFKDTSGPSLNILVKLRCVAHAPACMHCCLPLPFLPLHDAAPSWAWCWRRCSATR